MVYGFAWSRTAIGGIGAHVARSADRDGHVANVVERHDLRILEMRVIGMLHVVTDAAIDGRIVLNRHMQIPVLPGHLHALDRRRGLRSTRRVSVYLRLHVIVRRLEILQCLKETSAELRMSGDANSPKKIEVFNLEWH
jgi:hypothetical protein